MLTSVVNCCQNVAQCWQWMSNVDCRVWSEKRLEPCRKSLQRLSDIALWERNEKLFWKLDNRIWEKTNGARRSPLFIYWLSRKRALCVICMQSNTGQSNSTSQMREASSERRNSYVVLVFCVQDRCCLRPHKQMFQPKASNLSASSFKRPDRYPWEVGGQSPISSDRLTPYQQRQVF